MIPPLAFTAITVHPLVFLGYFVFALIGAYAISDRLGKWAFPAPKPPKPEKYRIKIVTPDGYPLRDYPLELRQVNRVMSSIHAEVDTELKRPD